MLIRTRYALSYGLFGLAISIIATVLCAGILLLQLKVKIDLEVAGVTDSVYTIFRNCLDSKKVGINALREIVSANPEVLELQGFDSFLTTLRLQNVLIFREDSEGTITTYKNWGVSGIDPLKLMKYVSDTDNVFVGVEVFNNTPVSCIGGKISDNDSLVSCTALDSKFIPFVESVVKSVVTVKPFITDSDENEFFLENDNHLSYFEYIKLLATKGTFDGDLLLYSLEGVPSVKLTIAKSLSSYMLYFYEGVYYLVYVCVVLFGISLLIGIFIFAPSLARPIAAMHEAVTKVREGDYQHHIAVNWNGELGKLANDINLMIEELSKSRKDRDRLIDKMTNFVEIRNRDVEAIVTAMKTYKTMLETEERERGQSDS